MENVKKVQERYQKTKHSKVKCFLHILGEAEIHTVHKTQNMGIVNLLSTAKLSELQIFQRFGFLIYSALLYFAWNRNPYNSENLRNKRILIIRETYGKTQTFQSYGFLTYFMCGMNAYNSQNMRKVNSHSKEKICENKSISKLSVSGIFCLKQKSMQFPTHGKSGFFTVREKYRKTQTFQICGFLKSFG